MSEPSDDPTRTGEFLPNTTPESHVLNPGVSPSGVKRPVGTMGLWSGHATVTQGVGLEGSSEAAGTDILPEVPGYAVTSEIARGGMGRVFAARDLRLQREVAIKVLLRDSARGSNRFVRESVVTARLPHPGVPPVYELGTLSDGTPFLAMKLIRGKTLAASLKERSGPTEDLPRYLQVFEQVCLAVGFAHSVGVIHRDLKPLNVMVGTFGEVQVMDWGLAREVGAPEPDAGDLSSFAGRVTAGNADQTQEGAVLGTPAYMPPEQARGELNRLGPRSDVFSLGASLCCILIGRPPYSGDTTAALLRQAGAGDLREAFARLEASGADAELVALCKRCLCADPDGRPADGKAVADAVAAFRAGQEERARTAEAERAAVLATVAEQRKRRRVHMAVATLVLTAAAGFWWWQDRQADERKEEQLQAQVAAGRQRTEDAERRARNQEATLALLIQGEKALNAGDAPRAADALSQAERRHAEGGVENLNDRLAFAHSELTMLQKLDRIDNDRWTVVEGKSRPWEDIAGRWAKAFQDYGVSPEPSRVQEARQRIDGSLIRERLLTSLETWFIGSGRDPKLLHLLQAADADEFRNAARANGLARALVRWGFLGRGVRPPLPVWFVVGHGQDLSLERDLRDWLLQGVLVSRPGHLQVLMTLGCLDPIGQTESAVRRAGWFRAALAVQPHSATILNCLGVALYDAGDTNGSIAVYREALRLDPKFVQVYTNLGTALSKSGDLKGAVAAHRDAIRLDPELVGAYTNLGGTLIELGDLKGAVAACQEAIRLNPQFPTAHNILGSALYNSGDLKGAIAAYREAIQHNPRYARAYFNLATALRESGDLKEAIAAYRDAGRYGYPYPKTLYNLGGALRDSGDLKGAAAAYREAVRHDPNHLGAYINLGVTLKDLGDLKGAAAAHLEAIRLSPTSAGAYTNLGDCLFAQRKYNEALGCAREAVRLAPTFPNAHALMGLVLEQLGEIEAARAAATEAARLNPKQFGPLGARMATLIPRAPAPREVWK